MIKTLLGTCVVAMSLIACGSNHALLAQRSQGEAEHLQDFCKRAGLNNAETQRADAELASAAKHLKDGDEDEAAAASDLAGTLYRLALARKDLADAQSQVDLLKQGLAKDKDQLQTYQEILSEMKTVRKP
jgi:threonine dehydrogenase-like Zn-dependent dehydrogenase